MHMCRMSCFKDKFNSVTNTMIWAEISDLVFLCNMCRDVTAPWWMYGRMDKADGQTCTRHV